MSTKYIKIVEYILIIDVMGEYLHIIQKYFIYFLSIVYPLNSIYMWRNPL